MNLKFLFILLMLQAQAVSAYDLVPSFPREGSSVAIGLSFNCPNFPSATFDGQTHWVEISEDNLITLTVVFDDTNVGCPGVSPPSGRVVYDLGDLMEGEYSLVINNITDDQNFPPQNSQLYLDNLDSFQVFGAAPLIPASSLISILVLMTLCLIFAFWYFRKQTKTDIKSN